MKNKRKKKKRIQERERGREGEKLRGILIIFIVSLQ